MFQNADQSKGMADKPGINAMKKACTSQLGKFYAERRVWLQYGRDLLRDSHVNLMTVPVIQVEWKGLL